MSTVATEIRAAAIGIVLALQPARDQVAAMEIQRAPDSAGSPDWGSAVTVAVVEPGARTYTDIIGGAGPYHYRARHVRPSATPSAWTSGVKARPTIIPTDVPNIPQTAEVTGAEITFDANGNVVVTVTGDYDTTNLYGKVGNGSAPADPTPSSNDGSVSGRSGTIATSVKITTGNDAYVKVVGANVFGSLGEVRTFRQARRIGPFHKDTSTRNVTGTTAETTLETITIPPNTLGLNGTLEFEFWFNTNGTAGSRVLRIKLNSATVISYVVANDTQPVRIKGKLFNDGATNAQQILFEIDESTIARVILDTTAAQDTTAAMDIVVTGDLSNGADEIILEASFVELTGTD